MNSPSRKTYEGVSDEYVLCGTSSPRQLTEEQSARFIEILKSNNEALVNVFYRFSKSLEQASDRLMTLAQAYLASLSPEERQALVDKVVGVEPDEPTVVEKRDDTM